MQAEYSEKGENKSERVRGRESDEREGEAPAPTAAA